MTSYDFGPAPDYRAAEAVRVLDRNDSHRFWFRAAVRNGQRLDLDEGNERSNLAASYLPHLSISRVDRTAAFLHQPQS